MIEGRKIFLNPALQQQCMIFYVNDEHDVNNDGTDITFFHAEQQKKLFADLEFKKNE